MTSAQADNKIGVADSPTAVPSSGRTFPVNDYAFERIIYRASHEALAPIPWPTGSPLSVPLRPGGRPTTSPGDVVVVTWTVAGGQALADVPTPGMPSLSWKPYAHLWNAYQPQLTNRSPARQAGCLGYVAKAKIGFVNVLLIKSELHLATDAVSAPMVGCGSRSSPKRGRA